MATPFPFASGDVLTAAELNDIGEWVAFTPSWDNLTVGNAVQSFYYAQVNGVLFIQGRITFGSTTAISGSYIRFSSPVGDINNQWVGNAQMRNDGVATRLGCTIASGNNVLIQYVTTSLNMANVTATAPFTFGENDWIRLTLTARLS